MPGLELLLGLGLVPGLPLGVALAVEGRRSGHNRLR